MPTFPVQQSMRINLPHAKELAHELCLLPTPAVPALPTDSGAQFDIHRALSASLATYARNLTLLSHTAENLGNRALTGLAEIEDTDDQLAHALERLT
ncbi:hypothetical protein [Corynebacterium glutamicum]|uniref:hypothetical protein n=1 Tax=Corynebacterium glutamicum TaxID=1718 RepID=UPI0020B67F8D|nr:hypothetical protein [Corynebacterium glutamicum]